MENVQLYYNVIYKCTMVKKRTQLQYDNIYPRLKMCIARQINVFSVVVHFVPVGVATVVYNCHVVILLIAV